MFENIYRSKVEQLKRLCEFMACPLCCRGFHLGRYRTSVGGEVYTNRQLAEVQ